MNDLFPVEAKPEAFYSSKLRIEKVIGDGMNPTLNGGLDFALVRPVDRYIGEGIYLLGTPLGKDFYRVQGAGRGKILLMRDNKHYSDQIISDAKFDEYVLAIVVADIKVRHVLLLEEAVS